MESDFDIKFDPEEPASRPTVSPGFLEAFGVGNSEDSDPLESFALDADEEPVALSSFPEDFDFPKVVVEPTRGVALSISVTRGGPMPASEATVIDVPALDEGEAMSAPGVESFSDLLPEAPMPEAEPAPEEIPSVIGDAGDVVHLECPGCGGGLVLRREHLGIEGLCVWCHTPIVAAESARDGHVRVFPIFGGGPEGPKKQPVSEDPIQWIAPSPERPGAEESAVLVAEVPHAPGPEPVIEALAPEPAIEVPAPAALGEEAPLPTGPLDLESLYAAGGFVEPEADGQAVMGPVEEKESKIGFVTPKPETAPKPASTPLPAPAPAPSVAAEEPAMGFGSFLKADPGAFEPVEAPSAVPVVPTPWGPPILPAETPAAPRPAAPSAPSDFGGFSPGVRSEDEGPSPFEGPDPGPLHGGFGEPADPSEKTDGSAPENGFDTPPAAVNRAFAVGSSDDDAPTAVSFPGSTSVDGGFGASFGVPAPVDAGPAHFESPSVSSPITWDVTAEISDEIGDGFLDAEPAPAIGDEDPLLSRFASSESGSADSLFPADPEPGKAAKSSTAADAAAPAIHPVPIITSLPVGGKPKPKVRLGFMVLMVVLLGFACGAALASYVLPVDQYVSQARTYMEQKFGTAPGAAAPGAAAPGAVAPGAVAPLNDRPAQP